MKKAWIILVLFGCSAVFAQSTEPNPKNNSIADSSTFFIRKIFKIPVYLKLTYPYEVPPSKLNIDFNSSFHEYRFPDYRFYHINSINIPFVKVNKVASPLYPRQQRYFSEYSIKYWTYLHKMIRVEEYKIFTPVVPIWFNGYDLFNREIPGRF